MATPIEYTQNLTGQTVGMFQIVAVIGQSRWGRVYRAFQPTLKRAVALKVLAPELARDPHNIAAFREEARLAAQIIHGQIAAVYEAGAAGGVHYCAMELMDGPVLDEFLRDGEQVDEHRLLVLVADAAEALDFLWKREIPHAAPTAEHLLTDRNGRVKLIDVVPTDEPASLTPAEDILALGVLLAERINQIGEVHRPVAELIERMVGAPGRQPFATAAELVAAAHALDREMFRPSLPGKPGVEKVQPRRGRPLLAISLVVAGAVLFLALALWWRPWQPAAETMPAAPVAPPDLGTMVAIPAGGFYLDKYEVTCGDYKKFLDAIASGAPVLAHPLVERRDHRPAYWDLIQKAIVEGVPFNDTRLTWNSPVFGVDWFNAQAYATWRGKRLPTAAEWNTAARSVGNPPTQPNHEPWRLVYDLPGDISPNGVVGLAGSVSEWVMPPPNYPTATAMTRGSSTRDDVPRDWRSDTVGFRCAADKDIKP